VALPPLADREALKEISAIAMRCGGCGAKVGATVLSRALASIEPAARADVVVGLDAPDDAALVDVGGEQLSLQTVDLFPRHRRRPLHAGQDRGQPLARQTSMPMGGEPQTALAIATVPYGLESKVEADLSAMMAGANEVLREAGCALVGGHTSVGRRTGARLCRERARPGDGGHAQRRSRARRWAHPHQAAGHGHAACRRHAWQGKGALGSWRRSLT